MRPLALFALAGAAGCFVATPPVRFGAGKSPHEAQEQERAELTPPQLVPVGSWTGPVRVAKIRVWADDEYRAQNVRWQQAFADQLAYANALLGPELGLRLEAEYHVWDHHAPGSTLEQQLEALAMQDPGDGVLTVVGLTSSLGLVSATFDELGVATLGGNHMILRGYADVFERQVFDRAFAKLSADEREDMYQARRRHKTTAVLLHELGHNLGVAHEPIADTIMNPIYSDHSSSFTTAARDTMLSTLDARLGGRHAGAAGMASVNALPGTPAGNHPTIAIALDATGAATIDGEPIDDGTLGRLLQIAGAHDRATEILIRLAPHTPQSVVVHLVDRAHAAGLTRVSIELGAP